MQGVHVGFQQGQGIGAGLDPVFAAGEGAALAVQGVGQGFLVGYALLDEVAFCIPVSIGRLTVYCACVVDILAADAAFQFSKLPFGANAMHIASFPFYCPHIVGIFKRSCAPSYHTNQTACKAITFCIITRNSRNIAAVEDIAEADRHRIIIFIKRRNNLCHQSTAYTTGDISFVIAVIYAGCFIHVVINPANKPACI